MDNSTALLYGLVLSGGKSSRMGEDKSLLRYHGVPQREYVYELLQSVCEKVFLGIHSEQQRHTSTQFNYIQDTYPFSGPLNGILSAHKAFPDRAWLVLACDLPLLDQATLHQLVRERAVDKIATSMATKQSGLPEPLVTIWEPKGLAKVLQDMEASGNYSPRKFLLNADIKLVYPARDQVLYNANTLEEYQYAKAKLN